MRKEKKWKDGSDLHHPKKEPVKKALGKAPLSQIWAGFIQYWFVPLTPGIQRFDEIASLYTKRKICSSYKPQGCRLAQAAVPTVAWSGWRRFSAPVRAG